MQLSASRSPSKPVAPFHEIQCGIRNAGCGIKPHPPHLPFPVFILRYLPPLFNRLSAFCWLIPVILMIFWRPVWPERISTWDRATPRVSARNFTKASFAAPSTGGAVSRILSDPSSMRVNPFFEARGWIRTESVAASGALLACGRACFAFTSAPFEIHHLHVHLEHLFQVLQQVVFLAPEVLEFGIEPELFLPGLLQGPMIFQFGVLRDQVRFLARVDLDVLGKPVRGDQ